MLRTEQRLFVRTEHRLYQMMIRKDVGLSLAVKAMQLVAVRLWAVLTRKFVQKSA